jgi:PadR family transcriptional regulator, regulatory protein PadR
MGRTPELLPGTLDMLILKAVSLKPLHGYGVLLRIQQISGDALNVPQGSLYPALYRLEHQGLIAAEWGESENKRKAKFYTLTAGGRRRLKEETAEWNKIAAAIGTALSATPDEV